MGITIAIVVGIIFVLGAVVGCALLAFSVIKQIAEEQKERSK